MDTEKDSRVGGHFPKLGRQTTEHKESVFPDPRQPPLWCGGQRQHIVSVSHLHTTAQEARMHPWAFSLENEEESGYKLRGPGLSLEAYPSRQADTSSAGITKRKPSQRKNSTIRTASHRKYG